MLKFSCEQFPNASLETDDGTLYLRITLNIEPEMRKYFDKRYIYKGKSCYFVSFRKELKQFYEKHIRDTYSYLMNNAMKTARMAKVNIKLGEIKELNLFPKQY